MYEVFENLLKIRGVKASDVCAGTGIAASTFSDWKSGRSVPKDEKMRKIADYFGVTVEYLRTGKAEEGYYLNPDTAKAAQEIFENKDMRVLFDAARNSRPEDILMAADLLKRLKETNPEG